MLSPNMETSYITKKMVL